MSKIDSLRRIGRPRKHADMRAAWKAASAAYRRQKKIAAYHKRESDEWLTPPDLLATVLIAAGRDRFDLDPCSPSNDGPVPSIMHWTRKEDGLTRQWGQVMVWCNPPYSGVSDWTKKCRDEAANGAQVIALVFAKTGTKWWHQNVAGHADVLLLPGRLRFARSNGGSANSAPFDSALLLWNHRQIARHLADDLKAHLIVGHTT